MPPPHESTISYEQAEYELTYALILLYQKQYDEAYAVLGKIEGVLRESGLQQELVIARLRLAMCQFERGCPQDALDQLASVTHWLMDHVYYVHLVQVQLRWLPSLLHTVKSLPQLAPLRELLALESTVQELVSALSVDSPSLSTPKLTIRAFGEPVVLIDDQPVKHWRMARAMELFFFLLDANASVSKERIITALWPEFDERINQTFHSTIHQLRKLLGEACFVFHANSYSLDLAACYGENIWYDVQEFRRLRAEANRSLAHDNAGEAKTALLGMVELYQGDYGRSFSNEWCSFRRDELCTLYLEAQRQLAQIAWQQQAYDECLHHWRCVLAVDNCQEDAYYQMMLCYQRQAKRSAALRQYQICKETLWNELGIEPGEAIECLYRELKARPNSF
jgi:LuxR family transcriptional regulator, maltose regulon positive regulatory protein